MLGEVGWDCEDGSFVLEIVFLKNEPEFIKIGGEYLLGEEGFGCALVFDFKGNTVFFIHTFGRAEFFLSSKHGVVGFESEESVRV